jgi:hypothetical protein
MMSGTLVMSAVTIVALTGITLTSLNYNNNNNEIDYDYNYEDEDFVLNNTHVHVDYQHPKFRYDVNQNGSSPSSLAEKRVVKRSSDDSDYANATQYSIDDKNSSMIDEAKRQKVKEVIISFARD